MTDFSTLDFSDIVAFYKDWLSYPLDHDQGTYERWRDFLRVGYNVDLSGATQVETIVQDLIGRVEVHRIVQETAELYGGRKHKG